MSSIGRNDTSVNTGGSGLSQDAIAPATPGQPVEPFPMPDGTIKEPGSNSDLGEVGIEEPDDDVVPVEKDPEEGPQLPGNIDHA